MVDLVLLAEAKAQLDKSSNVDDDELMGFISAATEVVESYVGVVIEKDFIERHPEGRTILIRKPPILTLTTIEPWLTAGTTYDVSDVTFEAETGIVERLDGKPFTGGPFRVAYSAGRDDVPPNIRLAALIIIAHMWETQRTRPLRMPIGAGTDKLPVPVGLSYSVPRRALELMRPHIRQVIVA